MLQQSLRRVGSVAHHQKTNLRGASPCLNPTHAAKTARTVRDCTIYIEPVFVYHELLFASRGFEFVTQDANYADSTNVFELVAYGDSVNN